MDCMLRLIGHPSMESLFPGLKLNKEGWIEPASENFPCCQLRGMFFNLEENAVCRCGLKKRVIALEQLLEQYKSIWFKTELPQGLSHQQQSWLYSSLRELKEGRLKQGFALQRKSKDLGPSLLWWIAIAAIWRFGYSVHVVNLQRRPGEVLWPENHEGDLLFFVEGVDQLWDSKLSFAFSNIVSWCDRSAVPLWLEFNQATKKKPLEEKKDGQYKGRMDAFYTSKIKAIKNRSPLDWMPSDAKSRLNAVCQLAVAKS